MPASDSAAAVSVWLQGRSAPKSWLAAEWPLARGLAGRRGLPPSYYTLLLRLRACAGRQPRVTRCSRACFLYKMRDCLHSSGEGGVEEKGMELIISKRAAGRKNLGKRRKSSNPTVRW